MPGRAPRSSPARRGWGQRATVPLRACRAPRNSNSSATRPMRSCSTPACSGCANSAAKPCEVDIEPLLETARLLYEGPWVAERYLATESLLTSQPGGDARRHAPDHLRRRQPEGARCVPRAIPTEGTHPAGAADLGDRATLLLLPTAGTHYRIADEQADPDPPQQHTRALHQFRESHGSRGRGGARGLHAGSACPSACR